MEDVATHLKEALAECFEQKANISIAHVDIGQKLKEKGMEHVWDIEVAASHMLVLFLFAFEFLFTRRGRPHSPSANSRQP